MTAGQLKTGLELIISRVGDGYYLRGKKGRILIDADLNRFTFDEKNILADNFSLYTREGGFIGYLYSDCENNNDYDDRDEL